MWYKPSEALRRYAIFFNSTTLAGAFGSLIASGINNMDGTQGKAGWRWIFILEGVVTVAFGLLAFILVPNFIEDTKWLKPNEQRFLRARIDKEGGNAIDGDYAPTYSEALKKYFSDYKSYLVGVLYLGKTFSPRSNPIGYADNGSGGATTAYSIAYFLPTIVKGFKYSTTQTQLHSVPPFAAAWGWSILTSFLSARLRHRLGFILFSLAIAIVGTAMLFRIHDNIHAEYAGTFLATMGTFGALPIWIMWYTMNLQGHLERSIGTAWMLGFGNLGGIVATFSFQSTDAPYYHKGYSVFFFGLCLMAACSILYSVSLFVERRQSKGRGEDGEREKRIMM